MNISSVISSIKKVLGGGGKSVIGIDIGSSSIKIVQARKEKGTAVLETYGSLAIGPYVESFEVGRCPNVTEEMLHSILSALLKETKITANIAAVAIPFHASLISLIDMPPLSDEKIAQAIPFEARRFIPIPLEDVSIDWFIVPKILLEQESKEIFKEDRLPGLPEKEEIRKVLLIAIHNHELIKHRNILNRTNLQPKFFEIEIFSTIRSSVFENRIPFIIIDIGARTTKFYVIEHGIVLRSLFINNGGEAVTQAIAQAENIDFKEAEFKKREFGFTAESETTRHAIALVVDEIFSEANNIILDFEQRYHHSIAKIILTGGGATMKGILEEAKKKTNIEVEIANPFGRLRHPAFLSETLQENGAEFSVAVGAALRALNG